MFTGMHCANTPDKLDFFFSPLIFVLKTNYRNTELASSEVTGNKLLMSVISEIEKKYNS